MRSTIEMTCKNSLSCIKCPFKRYPGEKICLSSIEELLAGMAGKFRMYD